MAKPETTTRVLPVAATGGFAQRPPVVSLREPQEPRGEQRPGIGELPSASRGDHR